MADAREKALREHVRNLLTSHDAHADFDRAVAEFPAELRGKKPRGAEHTPWQVLEHLRIAQWDILEFSRDAGHVSPEFPAGYWPKTAAPPDEHAWERSVRGFRRDRKAMMALVADEKRDLFAPFAHGNGQTLLREALLTADHNAYHVGELVLLRRLLGAWG
ncbi:MAG TPA: DinB family protein [Terracidiphilus sp.]|nr:DinB family protein [Terracidiphilus sp.]